MKAPQKIKFKPSIKQHQLFKTFGNKDVLECLWGGGAGGGKSFGVWSLMIMKALEYKGIRIGLARQTLVQIKSSTITTFFEVANHLGLNEKHYTYNEQKGQITFYNGSVIKFFELRFLPTDPNYDRFGGALLTFGVIEEGAGCDAKGKEIFSSRLGRWMNDIYDIPAHLYITTNPGINFVYQDFYNPWVKGTLEPFRMYIPATLDDNNYAPKQYAETLKKRLGEDATNRLLKGIWDFDSEKTRLSTYDELESIYQLPKDFKPSGDFYISADIAFTSDKCIILVWQGLTIIKVIEYKGGEPEVEIERLALEYKVPQENIVYDADGVGKYLKKKLPRAWDFINNSKALYEESYDNLKTQVYFKLAEKIKASEIKSLDKTFQDDVIQELYAVKSPPLEDVNGKLKIISKKEIKKQIGRSPDMSDAIAYRMVFEIKKKVVKTFTIKGRR